MKVWTGHLDCPPPGIQRQSPSLWVGSNPRLGKMAIPMLDLGSKGEMSEYPISHGQHYEPCILTVINLHSYALKRRYRVS
jgi:hypothetical protein